MSEPADSWEAFPEALAPTGPGHMPLFSAVLWIASQGHRVAVSRSDTAAWNSAYAELISRISSDEIELTGMKDGRRRRIEGYVVAHIAVDHPFGRSPFELVLSKELYLRSWEYWDDLHWNDEFHDSLRDRRGAEWTKLMVRKGDVLKVWPFDGEQGPPARTGAPGRPSSMSVIFSEFRARCERGEVAERVGQEADALAKWLAEHFPTWPQPTTKTITNRIRTEFRKHHSDARN